jgi:hypothetical protein
MPRLEWTSSHQCTSWGWGHWSHFGDEPKTHPPIPKVFGFFHPLLYPKVIPSYLPPCHLPPFLFTSPFLPPTCLPPPTYITWLCTHSIAKAREWFEWEPQQGAWSGTQAGVWNETQSGSSKVSSLPKALLFSVLL